MKPSREAYQKMIKEIFDYEETPVVTLPQFVIDRVQPCIDAAEDGLTFLGQQTFVNGLDPTNNKKLENDPAWWDSRPVGMPKLTPEFEAWRDNFLFMSMRQIQISVALIYNYKLEETPA